MDSDDKIPRGSTGKVDVRELKDMLAASGSSTIDDHGCVTWEFHQPWSVEQINIAIHARLPRHRLEGRNIRGIIRFTEADR